jgi:hypothetical protein
MTSDDPMFPFDLFPVYFSRYHIFMLYAHIPLSEEEIMKRQMSSIVITIWSQKVRWETDKAVLYKQLRFLAETIALMY